jgi:hypothetical protein
MRQNLGSADRLARLAAAALAVWLAIAVGAGTAGGIIVLVVAGILTATALSGFCPLYLLLGHLSRRRKLA